MVFKLLLILLFCPLFSDTGYFLPWGKDSQIIEKKTLWTEPKKRFDPLSKVSEKIILFHQNILSPVDGPRSHFRPTSSRYMLLSIYRYGFLVGTLMGFDRLLRENNDPWVYRTKEIDGITYKWDPTY
jgi:putative component of membrane protein insertase Oxa1/YidC/SpoIIIJ protein YidD